MMREKCLGEFKAVLLLIWVVAVVALMTLVTFEVFSPQNNNDKMRFLFIFILGVSLTLSIAIWKNKSPVPPQLSQNSREEIVERISLPPTYEDVMKLIENEKNREISGIQPV